MRRIAINTQLNSIMYADDEEDIRTIVQIAMETSNPKIQMDFAENGKILLNKLNTNIPDLILLDVMMPVIDGPTVLKTIRNNDKTKDIPVIFLTAKAQVKELKELEKFKVLGIITKPFDPIELYPTILNIWREFNE